MTTDKKVLVTGADGFIGSHLTEALLDKGYSVRALAQYNSFNNWGWLEEITPRSGLEIVCGDVRDPDFCRELCRGIDTVYHLAALIAIPYSYSAPDSYVDTNIKGTLNMCQAARDAACNRIVVTSTSEVYGTAQYVPIDEKHPRQPQSPYSATKIGADAIAHSFYNAFDLPVVTARPFNTYGPRQSARAIIPTIITQIAAGRDKIRLGDLTPTRDFINIATGREVSMAQTLETIVRLMGREVEEVTDSQRLRPAKSEVNRLLGDNTLITTLTDWRPRHSLEDGLRRTIDWFVKPENLAKYKTDIYNR